MRGQTALGCPTRRGVRIRQAHTPSGRHGAGARPRRGESRWSRSRAGRSRRGTPGRWHAEQLRGRAEGMSGRARRRQAGQGGHGGHALGAESRGPRTDVAVVHLLRMPTVHQPDGALEHGRRTNQRRVNVCGHGRSHRSLERAAGGARA
eukprot:scaffold4563_cov101-Isochrysis_galbana.AAC.3